MICGKWRDVPEETIKTVKPFGEPGNAERLVLDRGTIRKDELINDLVT